MKEKYSDYDRIIYPLNFSAKDFEAPFAHQRFDKSIFILSDESSVILEPLIAAEGSIFVYGGV